MINNFQPNFLQQITALRQNKIFHACIKIGFVFFANTSS